jgi:hypothetical protein
MQQKAANDSVQSTRTDECVAPVRQLAVHLLDVRLAVSDADPGDEHEGGRVLRPRNEETSS